MSDIGSLVAELIEAGCAPEVAAAVVARAFVAGVSSVTPSIDPVSERRREWDRKRKSMLPTNWAAMTAYVFKRDTYACTYCGDDQGGLHCDHVIPLSRGGLNEFDNLRTACASCNLDKGSKLISEWKYYRMGGFA